MLAHGISGNVEKSTFVAASTSDLYRVTYYYLSLSRVQVGEIVIRVPKHYARVANLPGLTSSLLRCPVLSPVSVT